MKPVDFFLAEAGPDFSGQTRQVTGPSSVARCAVAR